MNLYHYPIKNVTSKKYVFNDYYSYILYQLFDEPNFSIKSLGSDRFRFVYNNAFSDVKIIILANQTITVKQGNTRELYTDGTFKMDSIEQRHLGILNSRFPIEEIDNASPYKRYYDSLTKGFPMLLDIKYYRQLFEKSFIRTSKKFVYKTLVIKLSRNEYESLVSEINNSGFWTLPYLIECHTTLADGEDYVFEANTANRYQYVDLQSCPNNINNYTIALQKLIKASKLNSQINLLWKEPSDTLQK